MQAIAKGYFRSMSAPVASDEEIYKRLSADLARAKEYLSLRAGTQRIHVYLNGYGGECLDAIDEAAKLSELDLINMMLGIEFGTHYGTATDGAGQCLKDMVDNALPILIKKR